MDNENSESEKYRTGFNEGYLITQHLPDLSDQLAAVKNETPRIDGFRDGRKQFYQDLIRERRPSWLKTDRTSTTEKDQSKEDKEPER